MMDRRNFLAAVGAASAVPLTGLTTTQAADVPLSQRDLYELRQYQIAGDEQKQLMDGFLRDAAIPCWNRMGINPVGVFYHATELSPIFVLMRHRSLESVVTCTRKMLADTDFIAKAAAFLNAPADKPAFKRMESSLLLAFKGYPEINRPVTSPSRVFQLRIYESPSVKTGQKKIEMFNDAGEITIFKRVGLNPVFFGECLTGGKMPNLTYMLAFDSEEEQKAAWKKFGSDPDWQKLRGMEEYSDKAILCGITNLPLKPAAYSQV
jgi:hypothetical protein